MKLDFQNYVDRARSGSADGPRDGSTSFGEYAFSGDLAVLRRMRRLKPVRVIAESTVRFWKTLSKNELLGSSVKLSRRQFPALYDEVIACAETLKIPAPTVYIAQNLSTLNAGTYGTEEESFIVLNSALVDRFSGAELKFVIGHECGHIQNGHVVYRTAVEFLTKGVGAYVSWAVLPATMALNGWSRRAEITCDRAGLVCCRDLKAAQRAMLKIAGGSEKLLEEIDLEEYMKQLDGVREGIGRLQEYFTSHPYVPKRLYALQQFAESTYYRSLIGERGGRPLDEVDREVESMISVL